MPKGPRGEKRPADVIGTAVLVGRIATGEAEDKKRPESVSRKSGAKGGKKRAEKLTAEERKLIARKGAKKRWGKAS